MAVGPIYWRYQVTVSSGLMEVVVIHRKLGNLILAM